MTLRFGFTDFANFSRNSAQIYHISADSVRSHLEVREVDMTDLVESTNFPPGRREEAGASRFAVKLLVAERDVMTCDA